jgi:hypothetical protein
MAHLTSENAYFAIWENWHCTDIDGVILWQYVYQKGR